MSMPAPAYPLQLELSADRHITRWRPLVQHPRPLAYGQLDARPGLDDLLEHATRLVEVFARRRNKLAFRSRVIVC